MAKKKNIVGLVEELLQPILDPKNYELVDVEYVKEGSNWYLKIYIDKDGGITIEDCEYVSRAVEAKLDVEDPIQGAYILEVSSPGLDRPLKKEKDYVRNMGKLVEVKLFQPIEGMEKEFNAKLRGFENDNVQLELENGTEVTLSRKDIALIRLAVIF